MREVTDTISYYNDSAEIFARQASDKTINRFEYDKNMPSLVQLCGDLDGDVLDFGCGAGNFTAILQTTNRCVEGCDTSPRLLDIARQAYPNINFFLTSSDGAINSDKQYNLIVAKLVFHYITNLSDVLDSLHDSLSPGGSLLFSVPHPEKTCRHFNDQTEEGIYIDEVGGFGLTFSMVHRSLGRLSTLLANSGFSVDKTDTVYGNGLAKRLNILAKLD